MKFETMLDGNFIVSNEVQINIEGELVEEKAPAEKALPKHLSEDHLAIAVGSQGHD